MSDIWQHFKADPVSSVSDYFLELYRLQLTLTLELCLEYSTFPLPRLYYKKDYLICKSDDLRIFKQQKRRRLNLHCFLVTSVSLFLHLSSNAPPPLPT